MHPINTTSTRSPESTNSTEITTETRRTWRISVRLAPGGVWCGEGKSPPYELTNRGPTAAVALDRIRASVDAFDDLIGRATGGGL
jgi:hypothetical protein